MSTSKWLGGLLAAGVLVVIVVLALPDDPPSTTSATAATTADSGEGAVTTEPSPVAEDASSDSAAAGQSTPRLDGRWVRTQGPIAVGTDVSPYWILGTWLIFDESVPWVDPDPASDRTAGQMIEQTGADYVVELGHPLDGVPFDVAQPEVCAGCFSFPDIGAVLNPLVDQVEFEGSWACEFSGEYQIAADPTYEEANGGNVDGVLRFPSPGSADAAAATGTTFQNDCTYTASATGGGEATTQVSGLHVPVAATPDSAVGFQIVDYDTLIVYAFERVYIYKRQG